MSHNDTVIDSREEFCRLRYDEVVTLLGEGGMKALVEAGYVVVKKEDLIKKAGLIVVEELGVK